MKTILTGHEDLFGPWMMEKLGSEWFPGRGSIIGLWENGPIAASMFESFNGASVLLHCVGEGRKWLNREFLWFTFYYPFEQLGAKKILSPVESDNANSRKFIEHIGFTLEATLKEAAPNGDLLIYSLTRDHCKWLDLKEKYRGKTQGSGSS